MKRSRLIPALAFLSVAVATLMTAAYAYFSAEEAARIKFEAVADDAVSRLESRIDQHLALLYATQSFFEAKRGTVSRGEFARFVGGLDLRSRYSGARSIGYAALVATGEERAIDNLLALTHGQPARVWPDTTDQKSRAPVVLLAPLDERNANTLGYDMNSEPVRRAAMADADRAGEARASGLINLVAGVGEQSFPGFIVYLPVSATVAPGRQDDLDQQPVMGFLYADFRIHELVEAALDRVPSLPVALTIRDTRAEGNDRLMFRSEEKPGPERQVVTREIVVAGRPWLLEFTPTDGFERPTSRAVPLMLGLFGLLLATAIAFVARLQDKAYSAVEQLHAATEKSLLEKDLMLQEMKHRIKNSIARVLAIARQTASNSASIAEFSSSFGARLQAMAASQDMLTRSAWQKADLEQLLRTELEQVFGKNFESGTLRGPRVKLDEATTQALGLTFHELATNALKYGEVGSGETSLRVEWRIEGARKIRTLALSWIETGPRPVAAPERKGFGTRLIEMNIVRELGGEIERDYRQDGLAIRIRIPHAG